MAVISFVRQLRDELECKLTHNSMKRGFIPKNEFDLLMSRDRVLKVFEEIVLSTNDRNKEKPPYPISVEMSELVFTEYRKILAILVFIGSEPLIISFLNHRSGDENLPFAKDSLDVIDPDLSRTNFLMKQYCFIAVEFKKGDDKVWAEEFILPFTKDKPIFEGKGGFGTVYEIEILNGYYDPNMWTFSPGERTVFARKELIPGNDNDETFARESSALKTLQTKCQHPNIVPLLACYKYGSQYNFIFPRAECDLYRYFKDSQPPCAGKETIELLERISKLAAALNQIHNCPFDMEVDGRRIDASQIGFHRDLKPQNILKLGKDFMIADFGLARFKVNTLNSQTSWRYGESTYTAPECRDAKVGRKADVWSLGCIFSEVVTFAVLGMKGIQEFKERRQYAYRPNISLDMFYDYETDSVEEVSGSEKVWSWFEHLRQQSGRDQLILDVLELIEDMLAPVLKRLRAETVMARFSKILEHAGRANGDAANPISPLDRSPMARSNNEQYPQAPSYPSTRMERGVKLQPCRYKVPKCAAEIRRENRAFSHLEKFDTVFLIDDSESMNRKWNNVALSLYRFIDVAILYDSNGVDLHFMNSQVRVQNSPTVNTLFEAFQHIKPAGETSIRLSLDKLLSDYISRYKADRDTKRLNLIVITDGNLTSLESPSDVIINCAKTLDRIQAPIYQVGVQFVMIGSSENALRIFEDMDDNLWKRNNMRDMVDTTLYDPNKDCKKQRTLLKIMCGAVNRVLDNNISES